MCDVCMSVDADGVSSVMVWGANYYGQLGLGTTSDEEDDDPFQLVPVEVPSLHGRRVMALEGMAAEGFTVALL